MILHGFNTLPHHPSPTQLWTKVTTQPPRNNFEHTFNWPVGTENKSGTAVTALKTRLCPIYSGAPPR